MGHKVNPRSFRTGYLYDWDSTWFGVRRDYVKNLHEDLFIRGFIEKHFSRGGIQRVVVERFGQRITVNIHTARPGIVIGRGGSEIENLKKELSQKVSGQLQVEIYEVEEPDLSAILIAQSVARSIEKRIAYRRAMKRAVQSVMSAGAIGVRITAAGRLNDAEIARSEWYREGRVPLHTLRADIDYGFTEAQTTYGKIGIKVWIFKKEIIKDANAQKG
ncbi:MAG: 30S ribosomal protein S3 [bacterium]|nr:30S ribosomal protein S3 [bacterium]